MARARNIKPGFYLNEDLAGCSLMARFIFPGLWMLADREGRLEDRPLRIKAAVLPYDNGDVNELINELQRAEMLVRYEHSGNKYIQVLGFTKHQNPHCQEKQSTIPAPCEYGASTVQTPEQHRSPPADSLLLIPESLLPDAPPSPAKGKRACAIPFDCLPAEYRDEAKRVRPELDSVEISTLGEQFIDHHRQKGTIGKDWLAGWRTWLRNDLKFSAGVKKPPARGSAPMTADGMVIRMYQPTAEELAEAERQRGAA